MKFVYISTFLTGFLGVLSYYHFGVDQDLPLPQCQIYKHTGLHCPGCGSQRAVKSLINFDVVGAMSNNVLFVVALLGLLCFLPIWAFNSKAKTHLSNFVSKSNSMIFVLIVVLLFMIFRNITVEPFSWLAPISKE